METKKDASPIGKEVLSDEVPRVVKAASGVWDVLMKDSRRRVYGTSVSTFCRRDSATEEAVADDDAEQGQAIGSFESLLCRIEETDAPDLAMCKLLGNLMWNDMRAIVKRRNFVACTGPDLFAFEGRDQDELRIYDTMQWIYAFQDARPDEAIGGVVSADVLVSFSFVCERLGWDAEWIRRVAARCLREHFKGLLRTIAAFDDEGFLIKCERKLDGYVDVTGWRNQ
ncbi:hypothetical protein KAF44_29475 (plasmid) [Cupriavidus necator]|nr:hypothetical protein KAF44_29475 [Cupriavidus necator]